MIKFVRLVTVLSILCLSNFAVARPGPFPGNPGGHGNGGGIGFGRGQIIYNPNIRGYVLMAGANVEATVHQYCIESGYRNGGELVSTQWIVRAPATEFNNWGWQYYPSADNYQGVASVECFGRGGGNGNGNGNGWPDQVFNRPLLGGYPIHADQQSSDAYCRDQGYRRSAIQQTTYVDTHPSYSYRNGWLFSPNSDHYYMIEVLACYRR